MQESTGEAQTGGSSAEALAEVLLFIRQALAALRNIQSQHTKNNDLMEIDFLRWENELLKKRLSELEKMIKALV